MRNKEVVFDTEKRKEYLTGFRKRKNERRARAKEQFERSIKEERKRIRNDVKKSMASMKKTFQPLSLDPEIEEKFIENDYEDEEVQINVIELATGSTQTHDDNDNASIINETVVDESYINTIPGMEYNTEGIVNDEEEKKCRRKQRGTPAEESLGKIGNKKILDKMKKRKSLKELKKSKIFKQKERVEGKKQQKMTRIKKYSTKNGLNGYPGGGKSRHHKQSRRGHDHRGSSNGRRK
ncbi:uncharacterized protein [Eurosta solidaginis]|uniref:uncharacterized protein n=1 Tax=Eurosta solidaginis TaxID=178769 RepID=UPI0035313275